MYLNVQDVQRHEKLLKAAKVAAEQLRHFHQRRFMATSHHPLDCSLCQVIDQLTNAIEEIEVAKHAKKHGLRLSRKWGKRA